MKLHEIPRGSKIHADGEVITFHNTDGMYSYCTTSEGNVVHLAVWTPLKKVDDHYEIDHHDD